MLPIPFMTLEDYSRDILEPQARAHAALVARELEIWESINPGQTTQRQRLHSWAKRLAVRVLRINESDLG